MKRIIAWYLERCRLAEQSKDYQRARRWIARCNGTLLVLGGFAIFAIGVEKQRSGWQLFTGVAAALSLAAIGSLAVGSSFMAPERAQRLMLRSMGVFLVFGSAMCLGLTFVEPLAGGRLAAMIAVSVSIGALAITMLLWPLRRSDSKSRPSQSQ